MLKYQTFFLAMMLMATVLVDSGEIHFQDCGNGEMKSLEVDGCDMNSKCVLHRGQTVKVSAEFEANSDSKTATFVSHATINGQRFKLNVDPDVCKLIKCPLVKGQVYKVKHSYKLPAITPKTKNLITCGKLTGDNGKLLACAKTEGGVIE